MTYSKANFWASSKRERASPFICVILSRSVRQCCKTRTATRPCWPRPDLSTLSGGRYTCRCQSRLEYSPRDEERETCPFRESRMTPRLLRFAQPRNASSYFCPIPRLKLAAGQKRTNAEAERSWLPPAVQPPTGAGGVVVTHNPTNRM